MNDQTPDILDELFHACALAAFVEQARAEGGWPDPEATRRKAFVYYEESLAARTGRSPARLVISSYALPRHRDGSALIFTAISR